MLPAISDLIPHRPPMRLLDQVESFDISAPSIVCSATLAASPLMREGNARAVIALELMGQAAAACTGMADASEGDAVRGFLVSVPALTLEVETLAVGDTLRVTATRLSTAGDSASFECSVTRDGQPVASARLLVVREATS